MIPIRETQVASVPNRANMHCTSTSAGHRGDDLRGSLGKLPRRGSRRPESELPRRRGEGAKKGPYE